MSDHDIVEGNGDAPVCPVLPEWPEHVRDAKQIIRSVEYLGIRIGDIHDGTKHLESIASTTRLMLEELRAQRREQFSRVFGYGVIALTLAITAVIVHHSLNGSDFTWKIPGASFESHSRNN